MLQPQRRPHLPKNVRVRTGISQFITLSCWRKNHGVLRWCFALVVRRRLSLCHVAVRSAALTSTGREQLVLQALAVSSHMQQLPVSNQFTTVVPRQNIAHATGIAVDQAYGVAAADKMRSLKKQISLQILKPTDTLVDHEPEPTVEALVTPSAAEVEARLSKELEGDASTTVELW